MENKTKESAIAFSTHRTGYNANKKEQTEREYASECWK